MVLLIEGIILCVAFTLMVFIISRKPINTLYNYPPKIQERVRSLDEYKDRGWIRDYAINESGTHYNVKKANSVVNRSVDETLL